jgi:predicted HTH transcriptional regulator
LYDFYRRVIRKLTAELKVPFVLKGDTRIDDTPVHQALREALVNTLIHADYSDRASVLVVKQPAGFVFRNPGIMRVPVAQALHGGESDCRNRTLHQMFLLINLGERAGSGLPKIRAGWEAEGHTLRLFDSFEPFDQTRLEMGWGESSKAVSTETPGETSVETSVETSAQILLLLKAEPGLTAQVMAQRLGLTLRAVELQIAKLKIAQKLRRVGPNKGGHWEVLK